MQNIRKLRFPHTFTTFRTKNVSPKKKTPLKYFLVVMKEADVSSPVKDTRPFQEEATPRELSI